MKQQSYKYLIERLNRVRWVELERPEDPVDIAGMRRRLAAYDKRVSAGITVRVQRRQKAVNEVKEAIHAGNYDAALKALKVFEGKVF